jgi:hypothetical protein
MQKQLGVFLMLIIGMTLFLQSCYPDPVRTNTLRTAPPIVSVSSSSASPGAFIEVTVETTVSLNSQSTIPENSTTFDLGICFILKKATTSEGCTPDSAFVLPSAIVIQEGESHVTPIKVTVKRGQTVSVKHKFSFTTASPTEVTLVGAAEGPLTNSGTLDEDLVSVTFE